MIREPKRATYVPCLPVHCLPVHLQATDTVKLGNVVVRFGRRHDVFMGWSPSTGLGLRRLLKGEWGKAEACAVPGVTPSPPSGAETHEAPALWATPGLLSGQNRGDGSAAKNDASARRFHVDASCRHPVPTHLL